MRKLKLDDKRGVLGLDVAKSFLIAILTLGVIAFAAIVAIVQLDGTYTSDGTAQGNLTQDQLSGILNNVSDGTTTFFSNAGSWFALLAVVIIILVVSVVIVSVNRFGGRSA